MKHVKINKIWVISSLLLWLFSCQVLFILVQSSVGEKTVAALQNQMRQELNFSDFHFLARSISDYTASGAIKCAVLEKVRPEFIAVVDLRYMESHCRSTPLLLNGNNFDVDLRTLNGDVYHFKFISTNSQLFYWALWGGRILGSLLVLVIIFAVSFKTQKDILKYQLELNFSNKVKDIAVQVSHDIRSPLAALQVAINEIHIEDNQYKKIIKNAIVRIDEIANSLMDKNSFTADAVLNEESLIPLLESIVHEKKIEFKGYSNILIEFKASQSSEYLIVQINQAVFKRIISNLINNAMEAVPPNSKGKILIEVNFVFNNLATISIIDNGKGIPDKILKNIGEKGFSYGKEKDKKSGFGLGLSHAKNTIQSFGGKLSISSIQGQGTTIMISLPAFAREAPSDSSDFYEYVLIDNDELVRMTWEAKAKRKNVRLIALRSPKEFDEIQEKIHKEKTAIYIDYDLGLKDLNGEDFSKILHRRGYTNLTIATGHGQEMFRASPWLKHAKKNTPF